LSAGPHPFTLRQLQYVVAVADELSFHRAAARCRVSQPTLSAQLAQVEGALGVPLFERGGGRVLITEAGREVVERARRLLVGADDLVQAALRIQDPLAGTVRLGVIPTVSPYLLPRATPKLRKRLPRLRVAWLEEKTEVLVRRLRDGELEGAVLALEAELGDADRDLERAVIAEDPFVLVTPPGHALARPAKRDVAVAQAELRGEELLLLDEGHCFREQALEACGAAGVREGEFRATSLSTLVQMVAGGAGITLLPALAVEVEARRARLCVRPLRGPGAFRTLAVVWRKRSPLGPALEAVAAALRDAYPFVEARRGEEGNRPRNEV